MERGLPLQVGLWRRRVVTLTGAQGQGGLFGIFFFQAEDGIRDLTVTGVQTCALPISARLGYTRCRSRRRTGGSRGTRSFALRETTGATRHRCRGVPGTRRERSRSRYYAQPPARHAHASERECDRPCVPTPAPSSARCQRSRRRRLATRNIARIVRAPTQWI